MLFAYKPKFLPHKLKNKFYEEFICHKQLIKASLTVPFKGKRSPLLYNPVNSLKKLFSIVIPKLHGFVIMILICFLCEINLCDQGGLGISRKGGKAFSQCQMHDTFSSYFFFYWNKKRRVGGSCHPCTPTMWLNYIANIAIQFYYVIFVTFCTSI